MNLRMSYRSLLMWSKKVNQLHSLLSIGELGFLCDKTDSNVSCACVVGSAQCSGCVVYIWP